ncbi:hypothetical protein [Aureimonas leprariae]|nr:hypothetical protein [Aureimonas leprariae]
MMSARLLRNLGTENFGGEPPRESGKRRRPRSLIPGELLGPGAMGVSRYCRGRGTVIGFAPSVGFIVYVLWDEDEVNGIARGISVTNLVHVRDVTREADHAQHSPGTPFRASPSVDQVLGDGSRKLEGAFA